MNNNEHYLVLLVYLHLYNSPQPQCYYLSYYHPTRVAWRPQFSSAQDSFDSVYNYMNEPRSECTRSSNEGELYTTHLLCP